MAGGQGGAEQNGGKLVPTGAAPQVITPFNVNVTESILVIDCFTERSCRNWFSFYHRWLRLRQCSHPFFKPGHIHEQREVDQSASN